MGFVAHEPPAVWTQYSNFNEIWDVMVK